MSRSQSAVASARDVLRSRRGIVWMIGLSTLANVANYASSLIFSRVLEPVGFGELTSLLALSVILSIPLGAAQTVIAERVALARAAGDDERVGYLIRHALGHVATLGSIAGLLYILLLPVTISLLDLQQAGPAIALAPLVVLNFLSPVVLGTLQGLERFRAFGFILLFIAVSRIAFGVPWAEAGGGAGGAIAGQSLGLLVVMVGAHRALRHWLVAKGTGAATGGLRRRLDVGAVAASGAFIGFALFSNLDLLMAKLLLDRADAGIYAAIATIGKIVIFLPGTIAFIVVPAAAKAQAQSGDAGRILKLAGTLVIASALVCAGPLFVMPHLVVNVMFGDEFTAAARGVVPIAIAGAGLAVLNLLCVFSVAIRNRKWILILFAGLVLQIGGISLFHQSPEQIAWVQAIVVVIVLALNEALFHALLPRRRAAAT